MPIPRSAPILILLLLLLLTTASLRPDGPLLPTRTPSPNFIEFDTTPNTTYQLRVTP